jgi:hypothetical protein
MVPFDGVVEVVGLQIATQDCNCGSHACCGLSIGYNDLLRLKASTLHVFDGQPEPAIAAVVVSEGRDQCIVGYLPEELNFYRDRFDGMLVQCVRFL